MANNGDAVVDVAMVHAYGVLLGMVDVELAVYWIRPPLRVRVLEKVDDAVA